MQTISERVRTSRETADEARLVARAWLEVDLDALRRNAERVGRWVGGTDRILPMVKADAYGLGARAVAGSLQNLGVWGFGVATVEEGAALRRCGVEERIVVFTPCAPVDGPRLSTERLEPVVTSLEALRFYASMAGKEGGMPVHLEVDSGIGRFGLPADAARRWVPRAVELVRAGALQVASTFTHFHSAESDRRATESQWQRFLEAVAEMRRAGLEPGRLHAANTGALLRHPETYADVVRPGLYLYGGMPFPEGEPESSAPPPPEAVVALRARVLDVRDLRRGWPVSYGATYETRGASRLATLGIGYADGLPHSLSNRGEALVKGTRVPIRGAICMDMTVVDVTGLPDVRAGDTATLLGRDGSEEIRLSELVRRSGRIAYELLTGFSVRLPRILVAGEEASGSPLRPDPPEGPSATGWT